VKLLLDTHALVWAMLDAGRLSKPARDAIEAPTSEVFVSVASIWEIAIKVGIKKWPEAEPLLPNVETRLNAIGFLQVPILVQHVRDAGTMAAAHRDPFDRLLAAQALLEGLMIVTADAKLASLGAPVLW
jgi:PIN domain nuclease of toxin-antitoxin system